MAWPGILGFPGAECTPQKTPEAENSYWFSGPLGKGTVR